MNIRSEGVRSRESFGSGHAVGFEISGAAGVIARLWVDICVCHSSFQHFRILCSNRASWMFFLTYLLPYKNVDRSASNALQLFTSSLNISRALHLNSPPTSVNMAAIYEAETQWHRGEEEMHQWLRVPQHDNPTSPFLSPYAARLLGISPLVAVGTLDSEERPWTTIWGGEAGFSQPVAQSIIGMKATVDRTYDPVLQTLLGSRADGEVVRPEGAGKIVSALAIDLETRNRVKLAGRMIAGALSATVEDVGDVQLVMKIEQSLGMSLSNTYERDSN